MNRFYPGTVVRVIAKHGSGHGAEIGDLDVIQYEYHDGSGYKCQKYSYYPNEIEAHERFKMPTANTALAVITRNERGTLDHWLFSGEEEMEETFNECLSWKDKIVFKKVIEWSEEL